MASVLSPTSAVIPLQPPTCTRPALPPVFTATIRPLPPFMPPVPSRLTLHADGRAPRLLETPRKPSDPALKRVLAEVLADAVTRPEAPPPPAVVMRNGSSDGNGKPEERRHQMDEIAGSLESVARLLRGRGVSALFRNEPDPLSQRLFGVIADHLASRGSG